MSLGEGGGEVGEVDDDESGFGGAMAAWYLLSSISRPPYSNTSTLRPEALDISLLGPDASFQLSKPLCEASTPPSEALTRRPKS